MSGMMVIGPAEMDALRALRAYAETHERDLAEAFAGPADDDPGRVAEIPIGVRLVLSIDRTTLGGDPDRLAWVRRLSISGPDPGRVPDPTGIEQLMPILGFIGGLGQCYVQLEEIAPGHNAVELAELIGVPTGPDDV